MLNCVFQCSTFFKGNSSFANTHHRPVCYCSEGDQVNIRNSHRGKGSGPSLYFTWCERGLRPKDHKIGSVKTMTCVPRFKTSCCVDGRVANTHRAFLFQLWGREKYSTAHSKLGPLSLPGSPDQKQLRIRSSHSEKGQEVGYGTHSRCS